MATEIRNPEFEVEGIKAEDCRIYLEGTVGSEYRIYRGKSAKAVWDMARQEGIEPLRIIPLEEGLFSSM